MFASYCFIILGGKAHAEHSTAQPKATLSSFVERRADLHKARPYKKSTGEKEIWEEVGKEKLELIKIQQQIAMEDLKRSRIMTEQLQEEHKLKMVQMKEEHELKTRLLKE